ncbi:amidohydrolase family protein [Pseudoalteromonas sp. A25]|uniref:amidohydrolase family protein n=1 Tax=Pseudoalteromonas sp. A25 TaxID=116092 RepID=UPI001562292E|nr:amidohydrolase family protein [Pseudoalteromonas sp. A25]
MKGTPHLSSYFSLNHIFFDGFLDKLSSLPLAQSRSIDSHTPTESECCVFYGKIYCQFEPCVEVAEAMLVKNGLVKVLGSAQQVDDYINLSGLKPRFQYLDERHVICPGFVEPNMHLVISAILQQWSNLGPFGFDCTWHKLMPNYSFCYIARALLYLDKALSQPKDWLLGYGLCSGLLGHNINDNRKEVYDLINQLNVKRPVAVLDANKAMAYINEPAQELIYEYLTCSGTSPFTSKKIFKEFVDNQKGLYNEQLLWLVGALPDLQLQTQLDNIYEYLDKIVNLALRQGVTHIGIKDTHPFARRILAEYQPANINLVEPRDNWIYALNSLDCINSDLNAINDHTDRSVVINIGDVGYCGYEWVQSYHGQSLLLPCQQLVAQGYNVCLQSGFPMQPLGPMRAAEQACTRIMEYAPGCYTRHERSLLPEQCLTKEQSLNAITSASATHLGCEGGKLQVGGQANFVHLSDDPLATSHCFRDLAIINCYSNVTS